MPRRRSGQIVHLYRRPDSPNWYIYYRKNGKRIRKVSTLDPTIRGLKELSSMVRGLKASP